MKLLNMTLDALKIAKKSEQELHMTSFYRDKRLSEVEDKGIHNCGTAACVLGFAALHPDSPTKEVTRLWLLMDDEASVDIVASFVAESPDLRLASAEAAGIDLVFSHLIKEEPTLDDVIEYLEYVIGWLEEDDE